MNNAWPAFRGAKGSCSDLWHGCRSGFSPSLSFGRGRPLLAAIGGVPVFLVAGLAAAVNEFVPAEAAESLTAVFAVVPLPRRFELGPTVVALAIIIHLLRTLVF